MEKTDDSPEDVKRAISVDREIKKGQKDDTFEGYPRIVEKKKRWEHCDKTPLKKSKQQKENSNGNCCQKRKSRKKKSAKFVMVAVLGKPCTFPKVDIVPRHCLTKKSYIDMLATGSRKCPPDTAQKMVLRRLKPVSPRIKELAQPNRHRLLITLQEGASILPPALLDNLVRTVEMETCLTPEQAATLSQKKKVRGKKKGASKKDKLQYKEAAKTKKSSVGVASTGSFDKDSVCCQYIMAERFVRSILKWKCSLPKSEFKDIAEVIVGRLVDLLEYSYPQSEDRKSQQLRYLADTIACWITGVLSEVARYQEGKLLERCRKKEEELKAEEGEETDEEEGEDKDKDEDQKRYEEDEERESDLYWEEMEQEGEEEQGLAGGEEKTEMVEEGTGTEKTEVEEEVDAVELAKDEEVDKIEAEPEEREVELTVEMEKETQVEPERQVEMEVQTQSEAEVAETQVDTQLTKDPEAEAEAEAGAKAEAEAEEEEITVEAQKEAEAVAEGVPEEVPEGVAEGAPEGGAAGAAEGVAAGAAEGVAEGAAEREAKSPGEVIEAETEPAAEAVTAEERVESAIEGPVETQEEFHEKVPTKLDTVAKEVPKDIEVMWGLEELLKTELPFLTFDKIIDTIYKMIESMPENTGEDSITNGIHRGIYEKLSNIVALEDPDLLTEELKTVTSIVCGKIANWLRSILTESQIAFMQQYVPEVESKEIRDWTKWLAYISDVANDWNAWLRSVIEKIFEMESEQVTRGEWQDWTKSVDTKALLWRRFHLQTLHQAERKATMMIGRRVVKTGTREAISEPSEQLIDATDLQA